MDWRPCAQCKSGHFRAGASRVYETVSPPFGRFGARSFLDPSSPLTISYLKGVRAQRKKRALSHFPAGAKVSVCL